MSHHYGRHGPHAWLRWRKRHFRRLKLPMLARPEIRIIRVRIPLGIDAERIIYIIMADGNVLGTSDEEPRDVSLYPHTTPFVSSLPNTEHRMTAITSGDDEFIGKARIAAKKDLRGFLELCEQGRRISIKLQELSRRARRLADQELDARSIVSESEYDRLFQMYTSAYMGRMHETLDSSSHVVWWLEDGKQARLREAAIADKGRVRAIGPDNKLSYHRRDLGMLQVMVIYEISIDDALADLETLEKLQRLTDQYDDYQRYSENEVTWPTEATFQ